MKIDVDGDLAELSARFKAIKKLNPMQKMAEAESILLVLYRAVSRIALRVDALEDENNG